MAFDAYLRGRVLYEDRTVPAALQAMQYLKRAMELDPRLAAVYATLADVHQVLMDLHDKPHNELIAEAERYADQAVALDPDSPEAQLTLAAVRQMQWRWKNRHGYRRAIELHPTFARAHRWYGGLLLQFGNSTKTCVYRRGLELDPYDYPSQSGYGHALFHAGRAPKRRRIWNAFWAEGSVLCAQHSRPGLCLPGWSRSDERDDFFRKALERSGILRAKESAGVGSPGLTDTSLVGALAWIYHGDLRAPLRMWRDWRPALLNAA